MIEANGATWKEITTSFLKVGATAYGGPAIMGVMQAEFQERRQWVSRARFLEGLALVNVLPGATATQLGIFLGYARGGWWGGLLAGLCFAAPGFVVMLTLAAVYASLGVSPVLRGALYGLGPVVLGIFLVALYRLGTGALRAVPHHLIAAAAAVAALATPLGTVPILLLAGGAGLGLFHSRRAGVAVVLAIAASLALAPLAAWSPLPGSTGLEGRPRLGAVIGLFAGVGAFTFGGGLSMIPLVQEHMVDRLHWLTPQEFLTGLALGQLTPGPILMVAAYVGYTLFGLTGAVGAAAAAFVPSFVLMLVLLPVFERVRRLAWTRAVIQGIGPGVIGVMSIALARMAPHAAPDPLAVLVLVVTVTVLLVWRLAPVKAMLGGALLGIVRHRLCEVAALRGTLCLGLWGR